MNNTSPLRRRLLDAAKNGHILQTIYDISPSLRDDRDSLFEELATIHNQGWIDIVDAFRGLDSHNPQHPDFFLARYVFEKTLPSLNASIDAVISCVLHLYHAAGQDLAAGTIINSYIQFCTKDPERPRTALELIEQRPSELIDMMSATIIAGSQLDFTYYIEAILRLSRHSDIEIRRRAIWSISKIHWTKETPVPDSIKNLLISTTESENDGVTLGNSVRSAFAIYKQDRKLSRISFCIIESALNKNSEDALHAAAELLWLNTNDLPENLLHLIATNLTKVKPENSGTVRNIDYGIANLLNKENPEEGLKLLENLLVTHGGNIDLEILDSAAHVIRNNTVLTSKILTRWLLRGEPRLCEAVHDIAGMVHGDKIRMEVDATEFDPTNNDHVIFIARKAIGYFFIEPVTAASVVISLMRYSHHKETLEMLGNLLFNPLLINYPRTTSEYIKEQIERESGDIRILLNKAISSITEYLDILQGVPELPALHPSQSQRETYHRRSSESMAETMKAAEKKSTLANLVSRSTLLYGSTSIYYQESMDGARHRVEMPLTSHGFSVEFPRMDNIDPYDLNYMLRVFRLERFYP
ncbi:hypothetical protein R76696_01124 [Ralstonia mannitolilytica]|nr:hypothetical protein R76696_01124 [Ralstonia mannitolilytica]